MSRSSKRGKCTGRGSCWTAARCLQYAEPWAPAKRLANPEELINLDNVMDSGSAFCICQGIRYVYGRKCNYSIFRHAIPVRRNRARLHSSVNWAFRVQFKIDVCLNSLYCFANGVINNLFIDLVSEHQAP